MKIVNEYTGSLSKSLLIPIDEAISVLEVYEEEQKQKAYDKAIDRYLLQAINFPHIEESKRPSPPKYEDFFPMLEEERNNRKVQEKQAKEKIELLKRAMQSI